MAVNRESHSALFDIPVNCNSIFSLVKRVSLTFSLVVVIKIWIMLLLTLRRLMSYIYIYIYMEHPFLMFLDHTQRCSTVGRTPLDEWSARRRDLYLTTHDTHNRQISMPPVGFEPTISAGERSAAAVGFSPGGSDHFT